MFVRAPANRDAGVRAKLVGTSGTSSTTSAPVGRSDIRNDDGASGTTIAVDVGSPREAAELLRRATVLTPSGTVRAELVRTERVCISPCGDDEEECHGMGRDMYAPPIDLASCSIRPVTPFTILSCDGVELLYEGSRGIALSFADYGSATVQPMFRFRLNGRDAIVIRLGLKADVTSGLLLKGDDGQWRLTFRTPDYALLC